MYNLERQMLIFIFLIRLSVPYFLFFLGGGGEYITGGEHEMGSFCLIIQLHLEHYHIQTS